ncbi:hypothetical protein SEA_PHAYONCE_61 [Mycobacterium phage Phayonce]|uniref:Uncharacterized protein n=1 Tax=Mycobacterium phage Phayonce TaxID=1647302 RepID=A0A0F6WE09_9CAUD|nr:hypothetical protein SEA_PHAYONCE_61 [Mycobacterium phage Phayonce]AKF14421.1 hypothetical protein SEA_PHAYONCE_61 [Mycobacterium phage Phayonce]
MDIYVVTDGARVVGASARLQGAELIRADAARGQRAFWLAHGRDPERQADEAERTAYDRMQIVNTELQDAD